MARMMASCRAHSRFSASTSADSCLGSSPPARREGPKHREEFARDGYRIRRHDATPAGRPGTVTQQVTGRGAAWGRLPHSRVRRRLRACSSSRSAASCSASSARRRKARCARPRPPLRKAERSAAARLRLEEQAACWALARQVFRQRQWPSRWQPRFTLPSPSRPRGGCPLWLGLPQPAGRRMQAVCGEHAAPAAPSPPPAPQLLLVVCRGAGDQGRGASGAKVLLRRGKGALPARDSSQHGVPAATRPATALRCEAPTAAQATFQLPIPNPASASFAHSALTSSASSSPASPSSGASASCPAARSAASSSRCSSCQLSCSRVSHWRAACAAASARLASSPPAAATAAAVPATPGGNHEAR